MPGSSNINIIYQHDVVPRKDTLEAAQNDAEQLVMDRLRMKEQFVRKLEACGYSVAGKKNDMD